MKASGDGGHLETLKMLCTDLEHQFAIRDPYVFPGEMQDDVLSKLPQCVVLTNEHCFLRKDAELFASRLQSCGKLLDYCVRPGISHYSEIPGVYSDTSSILSKVVETYL
jgi:acetyl esterase/lipase